MLKPEPRKAIGCARAARLSDAGELPFFLNGNDQLQNWSSCPFLILRSRWNYLLGSFPPIGTKVENKADQQIYHDSVMPRTQQGLATNFNAQPSIAKHELSQHDNPGGS